jgi:hypothetical protein
MKMEALWFDTRVILDPVGASWATIGVDYHGREAVVQLQDTGVVQVVTLTAAWRSTLARMPSKQIW